MRKQSTVEQVLEGLEVDYHFFEDRFNFHRIDSLDLVIRKRVIGFCGKLYPVLWAQETERHYGGDADVVHTAFCYDIEALDEFVAKHYSTHNVERYAATGIKGKARYRYKNGTLQTGLREKLVNWMETARNLPAAQLFAQFKVPIFMIGPHEHMWKKVVVFTLNPRLADYKFFSVVDIHSAYQELSMYYGNIAQPNRPIPDVSDADMVIAKGFDKWSFRKEPSSPKRLKRQAKN